MISTPHEDTTNPNEKFPLGLFYALQGCGFSRAVSASDLLGLAPEAKFTYTSIHQNHFQTHKLTN
jgi:hypothetical protein